MKKWMIKWMKGRVTSKDGTWHLNIPLFIDAIFVYNTHMYLNIYVLLFYTNESPCRTFNVLVRCVLHVIFILCSHSILAQGLSFECSIWFLHVCRHAVFGFGFVSDIFSCRMVFLAFASPFGLFFTIHVSLTFSSFWPRRSRAWWTGQPSRDAQLSNSWNFCWPLSLNCVPVFAFQCLQLHQLHLQLRI